MAKAKNTRCGRCGRVLRSTASIARGYGRGCAVILRRQARQGFEAHQLASATELIEDGAIVATHDGVWLAVSTKGADLYACTAHACSCPAGAHDNACYHQLAVRMITALATHALAA
jgi:hypothetical protein